MCLVGVVVRRYIDFLILLIPTPLVSALFCSNIPTFFNKTEDTLKMKSTSQGGSGGSVEPTFQTNDIHIH